MTDRVINKPLSEVERLPDMEVVHFNIRTWVEEVLVRKFLKAGVLGSVLWALDETDVYGTAFVKRIQWQRHIQNPVEHSRWGFLRK